MNYRKVMLLVSTSLCIAATPALAQNFEPVTDEMLANPAPGDWPSWGRGLDNFRYSPLDQINQDNVGQLQLAWARSMEPGQNQSHPLAYNGVLYIASPGDVIQALDAATGDLIWEYRRALPEYLDDPINTLGERQRGIALYEDQLIFTSWDNHVVALDATNGTVNWETDRGEGDVGITNGMSPIIANGIVINGSTCQFSPFGCYITGHDIETGEEMWRNYPQPQPGEEGDDTWADSPMEARWMTGVWGGITYDPELDLVFYGSSAVGPASETQRGMPGATMWGTNTRFAARPQTGEIVWAHQVLPRDNWDMECTFEMLSDTVNLNPSADMDGLWSINPDAEPGERRVQFGIPCKEGSFWAFDAAGGDYLYSRMTTYQDILADIDETGHVTVNEDMILDVVGEPVLHCPSYNGGRPYHPAAYNPESKVYFIGLLNMCQESTPIDQEFTALDVYNVDSTRSLPEGYTNAGRLDAINVETGETVWSWEQESPTYAPVAATAGGLVFYGDMNRYFRAHSQDTGEVLWETRLGSQAQGAPITYEANGEQYVIMVAGGGGGAANIDAVAADLDPQTGGNMVYAFRLPRN